MAPKKKTSPKKGDTLKKGRKAATKTRDAALAEEIASVAPTRQVKSKAHPKPLISASKSASPSKITKKTPAATPKVSSKKTQPKDTQFRGPPGESSKGYKAKDSTTEIVKAIDGRTLTAWDKDLISAIDDLETQELDNEDLHGNLSLVVAATFDNRNHDKEVNDRVHFQIYWRFRKLCEKRHGGWPWSMRHESVAEGEDEEGDEEDIAVESIEKTTRPGRKSKLSKSPNKARSGRADRDTSGDRKNEFLQAIEDAGYAAALQHRLSHSDDSEDDQSDEKQAATVTKQQIEEARARGAERARSAAAILRKEQTLQRHAHGRGQSRTIPEVDGTGVVKSSQRGSSRARFLTTNTAPAKTPELPSPSKAVDPRKAESDKRSREVKRKADIKEREAIRDNQEVFPSNQVSWIPYCSERGNIISSTNPPLMDIVVGQDGNGNDIVQQRVNPFFETLPGPEVWHRKMPPYFSFGETKYMQQVISDQINRDLNRKHSNVPKSPAKPTESVGLLSSVGNSIMSLISPSKQSQAPQAMEVDEPAGPMTKRMDQWELPELTKAEKEAVIEEARQTAQQFAQQASPTRKRSATSMPESSTWGTKEGQRQRRKK
ncbi:hypothetical protein CERZMDRAFT_84637 [Cercospora zeae-maydis SCOH1-5]|uniref:Uncharacterized protein n=1 Tax=Cercospora zeae-maydis SCOH1-5 TaxID=717836 RepID=A0A6A6FFU0_9PEZI|nr:hypothetical protein CERZMDRAFT_84637 [Cercospora zeae-maydis SCOH1-5]